MDKVYNIIMDQLFLVIKLLKFL